MSPNLLGEELSVTRNQELQDYSVDLLDLLVPFGGSCVEPDGSSLADGEADTHTETETPGVPSVPAGRPASFSL